VNTGKDAVEVRLRYQRPSEQSAIPAVQSAQSINNDDFRVEQVSLIAQSFKLLKSNNDLVSPAATSRTEGQGGQGT
jgi:hypothetical protein